eukprot:TRINITY_DN7986_c0_g1_i1.p1 TRINITY_DN7986_c0_g1~~TRINITY_DN7986_c0_g1_i1.p1  ORF type:complete len:271 (+),score=39.38 TRINITY_DN7986_c0_g1_i1:56-868(+)
MPSGLVAARAARRASLGRLQKPTESPDGLALLAAARKGDAATVRALVASGTCLSVRDSWGRSPLYLAVWWGRKEVVGILLERGASPGAQSWSSPMYTPLHAAAFQGDESVAAALLGKGGWAAGVETRDACGRTPLELSEFRGRADPFGVHRHRRVTDLLSRVAEQGNCIRVLLLVVRRELAPGVNVVVRVRELPHGWSLKRACVLSEATVPGYWWVRVGEKGERELASPADIVSHRRLLPPDLQRIIVEFFIGWIGPLMGRSVRRSVAFP